MQCNVMRGGAAQNFEKNVFLLFKYLLKDVPLAILKYVSHL